jgi:glycosyltransferase involved in cell wall biosynthesis
LNILFIDFNPVGKGSYWRARHFGQNLAARGHAVTLIVTSRDRRFGIRSSDLEGLRLVEMPDLFTGSLRSGWDLWNILNRIAWVHQREFDIVHAIQARPTVLFPALYLRYVKGVPLVLDWVDWFGRGGSVEERSNPLTRAVLRPVETFLDEKFRTRAEGTIVICTTLFEKAIDLGVPPESILFLPDGADTNRLRPINQQEARQRVGLPSDVTFVGHVGSMFPRDARLLAQAFDLVHKRLPSARLLIIGHCAIEFRRLVQAPGAVIQTGFVEDRCLNDYLASCDVCLLPLKDTGANRGRRPLKLNDYMAVGRPTVSTAVGDIPGLFKEETIGYLAEDDPEHFASKIVQLLENPGLRDVIGERARQVAERRFSWVRLTDQLEAFYRRIFGRDSLSHETGSSHSVGWTRGQDDSRMKERPNG